MTRAIDDATSTCRTCAYWQKTEGDNGICQHISVPGWVQKYLKNDDEHRRMEGDDGLTCWMHTKRGVTLNIDPKRLMRRLAERTGNVCRLCGHDHNMPGHCVPREGR